MITSEKEKTFAHDPAHFLWPSSSIKRFNIPPPFPGIHKHSIDPFDPSLMHPKYFSRFRMWNQDSRISGWHSHATLHACIILGGVTNVLRHCKAQVTSYLHSARFWRLSLAAHSSREKIRCSMKNIYLKWKIGGDLGWIRSGCIINGRVMNF